MKQISKSLQKYKRISREEFIREFNINQTLPTKVEVKTGKQKSGNSIGVYNLTK